MSVVGTVQIMKRLILFCKRKEAGTEAVTLAVRYRDVNWLWQNKQIN